MSFEPRGVLSRAVRTVALVVGVFVTIVFATRYSDTQATAEIVVAAATTSSGPTTSIGVTASSSSTTATSSAPTSTTQPPDPSTPTASHTPLSGPRGTPIVVTGICPIFKERVLVAVSPEAPAAPFDFSVESDDLASDGGFSVGITVPADAPGGQYILGTTCFSAGSVSGTIYGEFFVTGGDPPPITTTTPTPPRVLPETL